MEFNLSNKSITSNNNKQLFRYLSSSIPLACMVALLLLGLGFIVPMDGSSIAYAEEGGSSPSSSSNPSDSNRASDSTASLTIGGAGLDDITPASSGEVAYRKHTITVDATNTEEYYLIINGPTSLTGSTNISGADNKLPAEMSNNSWGYAYSDKSAEDTLNYQSFTGNAETIDSGTGPANFTKNLIFAAKFGDDAVAGHYTGQVTLSLASTPSEIVLPTNPVETWDELKSMQQMTSKACASIGTAGSNNYPSKTLVDSRDGNEYTITKLDDQNCWMTTNLKLDLSAVQLTSADSNVNTSTLLQWNGGSDTTLTSSSSGFSDGTESTAKWNNGKDSSNNNWSSYDPSYGYYYNWCAATAGSCLQGADEDVKDKNAPASICPKGWRLPTETEYNILANKKTGSWNSGWTLAGGFFPAAGYVYDSSLHLAISNGYYWSSAAYSSDGAYYMFFNSNEVTTNNGNSGSRYNGFSVRCVAMTEQDEKEQEVITNTKGFGGIKKMQDMTSDICNQSSVTNGATGQLYDSRDLNIYDVAKLDDGKCWMTSNLALSLNNITLTPKDSHVDSNWVSTAGASELWNNPNCDYASTADQKARCYGIVKYYNGKNSDGANATKYKDEYGYYYSWGAATAGQAASIYTANQSATRDICPKGWKLPTITNYENFLKAANINFRDCKSSCIGSSSTSDSTKIRGIPYNFQYAGHAIGGSLSSAGIWGWYWSSTARGISDAYRLYFDDNELEIGGGGRVSGFPVRCIAQE